MHTTFDDATALTAAEDAELRALLEPLQRQAPPPAPAPPPASEPLPGGSKCEYERAVLDCACGAGKWRVAFRDLACDFAEHASDGWRASVSGVARLEHGGSRKEEACSGRVYGIAAAACNCVPRREATGGADAEDEPPPEREREPCEHQLLARSQAEAKAVADGMFRLSKLASRHLSSQTLGALGAPPSKWRR
jgi:hypothetical protein